MKRNIISPNLSAIRWLIAVFIVVLGSSPVWASHGTDYAHVSVTASPTGQGKVYMTTDGDKVPASEDWQASMPDDWNCKDGIGPSEEDSRTYYVHAKAESGYHFVKWSSNSSGTDSKSTEAKYAYSTKASGSSSNPTQNNIYAIFAQNQTYTVTFVPAENGTYTYQYGSSEVVTVTTEQSVTTNQNFALNATPDAGYELFGWYTESMGGGKTYFDYSSYVLPSYALPGDVRIGVDFMPIGTPLFRIIGGSSVYTDLNAAITACGAATKTIVLINNGTLPAGDYTIPTNVTLLIPFDAAYTSYTTRPELMSNTYIAPTAYRTLTMSPGAQLTVNGKISVSAKLSSKSFHGPCGAPSGSYGAIKMLSDGDTKSTITLNNGAKLYCWGYIYGEGEVEALSSATIYEGFTLMDWRGGQHTLNIFNVKGTYKVFPFNQYYIQNIEVPLTMHKGATESVYSSIYGDGDNYDLSITIVGESEGLFQLTGTGAKLTKWYDPQADRQHFEMYGEAAIREISFSMMSMNISSSAFVLPINNNMDITVKNGATVTVSEDMCIMPDASITVEEGGTMNITKNVYVYDKNAYTNAGTYTTSRGGFPEAGPGRYAGADYIQRMKYSPSWATIPNRELRRLQNMGSARILINGTLTVNGKLYTTEGGADIHSNTDGAAVILAGCAGTAPYTYQVDNEDINDGQTKIDYFYSIPITSAKLHNTDASYAETAVSAANTSWTYANGHWGCCIIWQLEDGTELQRMYQPSQPEEAWLASNAPSTDRADEGTCTYVFNGWNTTTDTDNQEITVVANYTKNCAEYYTVTWKSEDGTETLETDENVGQGEATRFNGIAPTKPIDQHLLYAFDGWSTEPNGGGTVYGIGETPAAEEDATYYAHFAVTDVAAVVIANGVTTYYTSVADALEAANNSGYTPTVQLWKNTTTPALTYTGRNHCTIDLNGYTLTGTAQPLLTIDDGGYTVTITDRSQSQEGKLLLSMNSGSNVFVVQVVAGILHMETGVIQGQNTGTGATAGVYANRQEVIMTGGKIQVEAQGTAYGIFTQGKVTVNSGTIHAESATKSAYSVQAYGTNGNAIINDGYFFAAGVKTVTCLDAAQNASIVAHGGYYNTNANLDTYKAATCRVYSLPSTKLPYRYMVAEKTPIVASVTINSVTTEYSSFADAWSAANTATAASTLKLLDDVDVTTQLTYDNTNSQNCTLDLNGYTLTSTAGVNAPFTINHSGINFTITDGTESKSGKLSMTGTFSNTFFGVFVQYGNLVLDAGTIEAKIGGISGTVGAVTVYNTGAPSFTMNGGTIYVKTTNNRKGRGVYANKTATINNGTILIEAAGEGVGVQRDAGTVNIFNGRFRISGSSASVTNQANNNYVKIYGGYYNINTNLSTACAANHHVFPNDDATYIYKVAEGYTLTWTTDGELAGEGYTPAGLTAVGTPLVAPTPTKTGYTFYGWTPEVAAAMPSEDTEYTAQWAVASLTINDATTLYTDFNTAWTAASGAGSAATLTLLDDVTGLSARTYNAAHDLTLDLNGHTLSGSGTTTDLLQVNCTGYTFTLTDGSADKDGNISFSATGTSASYYCVVVSGGSFVLDAGMIYAESSSTEGVIGAVQSNGGTFTMNENGAIHVRYTGNGSSKNSRMVNANGGTTIINGGAIRLESTKDAIGVVYNSGNVTFNGGKFHITASGTAAVTNKNTAYTNLNIRGGYYSATNNTFFNPHVKTPYHIFSIDEAPYTQRVAEGYTLSWNTDGAPLTGDYTSGLTEVGTSIVAPNTPTKTGYSFAGWSSPIAETMPSANTEYTAQWTAINYSISYDLAGGSVASANPTGYTVESSAITLNNPTKDGYIFSGWTGTDLAGATMSVTIPAGSIGDRSYTSTWVPVVASVTISGNTEYYVDFNTAWTDANGAATPAIITLLGNVTVTGSQFALQYSGNQNCTLDLNGHTLTGSATQVALYMTSNVTVTVTDGSANKDGKIYIDASDANAAYGVLVSKGHFILNAGTIEAHLLANTSKGIRVSGGASFTMNGGAIEVETTNNQSGDGVYTSAGNATVTIHGGEIHVHAAAIGYAVNVAGTTTITGGKFSASGASSACVHKASGTLTLQGGYYSADTNLADNCATNYHVFPNEDATYIYKVAEGYTVTFLNGEEVLQSETLEKGAMPEYTGAAPTKPEDAQYTYAFSGWEQEVVAVTADAIYTAQFSPTTKTYTVTWKDADGTTLRIDENVPYGTMPSYGSTPTKATDEEYVYTFAGWDITPVAVTADATYTATYSTTPVVASVMNNSSGYTLYYTDFDDAFTAAKEATVAVTITLLQDASSSVLQYSGKNTDCTLDLNGHTFTSTATQLILNVNKEGSTFTITDKTESKLGQMRIISTRTDEAYGIYIRAGHLILAAGTIYASLAATTCAGVRAVNANSSFTMNGGTVHLVTTNSNDGYGIMRTGGTVTVNDGKLNISASGSAYVTNQANNNYVKIYGGYYNIDSNLSTACATNYRVFPNSDEIYRYKVADGYTVTFNNYDGTALQTGLWEKNTTPVYSGDTPTKPEDEQYTYEFAGWDAAIVPVVADATYTATYNSTPKPRESIVVNEGETTTIDADTETTTTTVHVSGTLEVADNVTLTTNDLILEATPSSSGEILGDVAVTQNAYFDLSQPGGFKAKTWYAIALPWQVEVPAYALGDVSLSNDGENYTPQTLGTTFDLIYYDGARRATGASKAWQYVEDDPAAEHVMVPGRAYMIYLTSSANVIRFRKSTSAALHTNELDVLKYPSSVDANYADWNGIANPATFKAFLNVGTTENLGQVYNAETKGYEWFNLNTNQLQVGQPIFVQPIAAKTVVAEREGGDKGGEVDDRPLPPIGPAGMPLRRAKASVTTLARYEVALSSADDQEADRIIVRMDDGKEADAYTVGLDLAKMGLSTVVPQMWVNRYHTQLCVNTAFPTNNRADFPLDIYVPQSGEYALSLAQMTDDQLAYTEGSTLYLTYDGKAIWNLSYGGYTAELEKGENTHYGLRIIKNTHPIVTDIEDVIIQNGEAVRKVIVNDKVFIIRNGDMYSIDGRLTK